MGWQKTCTATSSLPTPTISRSQPFFLPLFSLASFLSSVSPLLFSPASARFWCVWKNSWSRLWLCLHFIFVALWHDRWHVCGTCIMTAMCLMPCVSCQVRRITPMQLNQDAQTVEELVQVYHPPLAPLPVSFCHACQFPVSPAMLSCQPSSTTPPSSQFSSSCSLSPSPSPSLVASLHSFSRAGSE